MKTIHPDFFFDRRVSREREKYFTYFNRIFSSRLYLPIWAAILGGGDADLCFQEIKRERRRYGIREAAAGVGLSCELAGKGNRYRSVFATKQDYRNNAKSILACSLDVVPRDCNCKEIRESASLHANGRFNFTSRRFSAISRSPFLAKSSSCVRRISPFFAVGNVSLGICEKILSSTQKSRAASSILK